jgi:hypothetical protein
MTLSSVPVYPYPTVNYSIMMLTKEHRTVTKAFAPTLAAFATAFSLRVFAAAELTAR